MSGLTEALAAALNGDPTLFEGPRPEGAERMELENWHAARLIAALRAQGVVMFESREALTREVAEALEPVIEGSLSWLQLWRFDKQDEDPWPELAAAIVARLLGAAS